MGIITVEKRNEYLNSFIEVEITDNKFPLIKETLTRIGVCPKQVRSDPVLYQSCHILSMQNRYFIVHFKELFLLDGKESSMDELDYYRRNQVAKLLADWNLLKIKYPERLYLEDKFMKLIKITPASDKENWTLVSKYHIGADKFKPKST